MGYGEAWRLMRVLIADPSSQLAASLAGWEHPATRESLALYDLYDLQHASKAKRKPKPYPRPWVKKPRRIGAGTSLTPEQFASIKARLAEEAEHG